MICTFDVFSTEQLINDTVSVSSDSSCTHTAALSASPSQGENNWASVRLETKAGETYILFYSETWKVAYIVLVSFPTFCKVTNRKF